MRKTLDLLVEEEAVGDLILALTHLGKAMDAAGIYPRRRLTGINANANRLQ